MIDGNIQAQGENVVQILVDCKPFFATDVKAVLQNLPAEVIESCQMDFNLWTRSSYKLVDNLLRPTLNNNYFNGSKSNMHYLLIIASLPVKEYRISYLG